MRSTRFFSHPSSAAAPDAPRVAPPPSFAALT